MHQRLIETVDLYEKLKESVNDRLSDEYRRGYDDGWLEGNNQGRLHRD